MRHSTTSANYRSVLSSMQRQFSCIHRTLSHPLSKTISVTVATQKYSENIRSSFFDDCRKFELFACGFRFFLVCVFRFLTPMPSFIHRGLVWLLWGDSHWLCEQGRWLGATVSGPEALTFWGSHAEEVALPINRLWPVWPLMTFRLFSNVGPNST